MNAPLRTLPTLRTDRLTLRPYQRDDFDAYLDFMTSQRSRYMSGPHAAAGAWAYFTNDAAANVLSGYGCYILLDGATAVGFCGVIHPVNYPEPELGWGLYEGFEGRGFATEAASAVLAQMFRQSAQTSFVSYIVPANGPWIAVAQRLGATLDRDARAPEGWNSLVYRHARPNTGVSL